MPVNYGGQLLQLFDIASRMPGDGERFEQKILPFPPLPTQWDLDSLHSESIVRGLRLD